MNVTIIVQFQFTEDLIHGTECYEWESGNSLVVQSMNSIAYLYQLDIIYLKGPQNAGCGFDGSTDKWGKE